jgi:hypothetical protein
VKQEMLVKVISTDLALSAPHPDHNALVHYLLEARKHKSPALASRLHTLILFNIMY